MKNPGINNKNLDEEWLLDCIREEIPQKDFYTQEDLLTVANMFFNYFQVGRFNYCGIDAFAEHHYGALLQKAINLPTKATEYITVKKKMNDFRRFSIEYFHYDPHEQKFIDEQA